MAIPVCVCVTVCANCGNIPLFSFGFATTFRVCFLLLNLRCSRHQWQQGACPGACHYKYAKRDEQQREPWRACEHYSTHFDGVVQLLRLGVWDVFLLFTCMEVGGMLGVCRSIDLLHWQCTIISSIVMRLAKMER